MYRLGWRCSRRLFPSRSLLPRPPREVGGAPQVLDRAFSSLAVGKEHEEALAALELISKHVETSPDFSKHIAQRLPPEAKKQVGLSWACFELLGEFRKADKNKDGKISFREFEAWTKELITTGPHSVEAVCTRQQLIQVFIRQIPAFVTFGIVDNSLMILAGDAVDASLGVVLGLSTMAAAALGNAFSNGVGMVAHGFIEKLSQRIGLKDPKLTFKQMQSREVVIIRTAGSTFGVVLGCMIGMWPLLFTPDRAASKLAIPEKET
eukprot:GEMP01021501.1.p1 GENE.GEMP01021501.1~~GEMP01021501.1.p1  ORF type:complete len:273 (-),score=43.26 GEMP01021501.1:1767-2558(-)